MIQIAQIDYDDLLTAFKESNRELIKELMDRPAPVTISEELDFNSGCQLVGLGSSAMYKLVADNKVPHNKFRGRIIFSRSKLLEWKNQQMIPSPTPEEIMARRLARSARKKQARK